MKCGTIFPDEYHIVPCNDFREHVSTCECWCNPTYWDEEDFVTFVHNPLDGRDKMIRGEMGYQ